MWDAIAVFIKSFNEKYLIPLVISIVTALIVIIVFPSDFWMINKIGVLAFGVAVAGLTFLVVLLICYFFTCVKKAINEALDRQLRREENLQRSEMTLRAFWLRIDSFSPEERKTIREMVTNDNQPVSTSVYTCYSPESLFGSELMVNSTIMDEQKQYSNVYKLKEEYFQLLKYSMERFGKISSFD